MGEWYGTCMLSGMPIEYEEPVVGFILEASHNIDRNFLNGFSYPYEMFRPISVSIKGKYDRYGCITKVEKTPHIDWLLEDEFASLKIKKIGTLLDKVERGYVFSKGMKYVKEEDWQKVDKMFADPNKGIFGLNVPRQTGLVLVRQDLYDAALEMMSAVQSWGNEVIKDAMTEGAVAYWTRYEDHLTNPPVDKKEKEHTEFMLHEAHCDDRNIFCDNLRSMRGREHAGIQGLQYYILRKVKDANTTKIPEVDYFTKEVIDFYLFGTFLYIMNIAWRPYCGKGGRGTSWEKTRDFYSKVVQIAEDKMAANT